MSDRLTERMGAQRLNDIRRKLADYREAIAAEDRVFSHASWDDVRFLLTALADASRLTERDNHHNALTCPHCNPRGMTFQEQPCGSRPQPCAALAQSQPDGTAEGK